jgi:hypothetical protein
VTRRLHLEVEGQTEEKFVKDFLAEHLVSHGYVSVTARLMGHRRSRAHRGGVRPWASAQRELAQRLAQDADLRVGLLVDYYGMPTDWPGRVSAKGTPQQRAHAIADALRQTLPAGDRRRFFPCVLMHEFEAFIFADCAGAAAAWVKDELEPELRAIRAAFPDPEHINDSPDTAPSKRLLRLIPSYEKVLAGAQAVDRIGLKTIRAECPAFNDWLLDVER